MKLKQILKNWLEVPEQKVWVKHGRTKHIKDLSATTAYQRGFARGKKAELRRILWLIENDTDGERFGDPIKKENLIGSLKFDLGS